jgi:N-acetylglutamate synthase-like GNAT family acetyltransferase
MKTRQARIEDAAEVCRVIRSSITELCFLDHGGDDKLLEKWLSNKTVENVRKWISQWHFFVTEEAGVVLGVGAMDDSGKITVNYVLPKDRFRGVSKALVYCMEDKARALGIEECSLETTETALRFYQALDYAISEHSYTLPLTGIRATVLTKRLRRSKTQN